MRISWNKDWDDIENRLGASGLELFLNAEIIPDLSELEPMPETKDGFPKSLMWPIMIGFFGFFFTFMFIESQMPRSTLGTIGSFLLFPILFISIMALTLYVMRGKIAALITEAQNNFLIRSQALGKIAERSDLHYVPTPGGTSKALQMIAKWKHCPQKLKDVVDMMEDSSGMDIKSEAIRRSGLAMPSVTVLGTDETKEKYYDQVMDNLQFEDGFTGTRKGIAFAALEWEESRDDFSYHHLLIHMTLPRKITGWVEFKNKACGWPQSRPDVKLKKVGVPYSVFSKAYDLRASDQTEARLVFDPVVIEALSKFAVDGPARGVAFENHLVIDIRGDNRFELVNIATGQWSEESIQRTLTDIADMLDLVDATAKSFALKARRSA